MNMTADFWAGYASGVAGIVIGNPLDIVKVRLQNGRNEPTQALGFPGSGYSRFKSWIRGDYFMLSLLTCR